MTNQDAPFEQYESAVLTLTGKSGKPYSISPNGKLMPIEEWPFVARQVYVITAHNPGVSVPYSKARNWLRNQKLKWDLRQLNATYSRCHGGDPSGMWPVEHSFAVENLTLDQIRKLAAKHGQAAVFSITNEALTVVLI